MANTEWCCLSLQFCKGFTYAGTRARGFEYVCVVFECVRVRVRVRACARVCACVRVCVCVCVVRRGEKGKVLQTKGQFQDMGDWARVRAN